MDFAGRLHFRSAILVFVAAVCAASAAPAPIQWAAMAFGTDPETGRRPFSVTGTTQPIRFDVFDERTKTIKRGLGYPALAAGKLTFARAEDSVRWFDPNGVLHCRAGKLIAAIVDPDLDAQIAAKKGQLVPLWSDYRSMLQVRQSNPEAMSKLLLLTQEGKALESEATVRQEEMEQALTHAVVAPADAEIIEGTRDSVNINPLAGDLFRYYPLTHLRFQVRLPLAAWGPDWTLNLTVSGRPAQILNIYSADLDETNEQWILGIEFKPAEPFRRMNDEFKYRLTSTAPTIQRLSQGLRLHPPSCALVGRRRTYASMAPKVPGLLFFTKEENSWVRKGDTIGGVTLAGMEELVKKVSRYRSEAEPFLRDLEHEQLPKGIIGPNDPRLIQLRQYYAEAGRLLERASAMTIQAKETGLLVGTLDYQGPLTLLYADLAARVKSPYVEIRNVVVGKDVDVKNEDVVFVEFPSGREELAKVFQVVPETVGPIEDLREDKVISVLVYDPLFYLGETAASRGSDPAGYPLAGAAAGSGMPVYVSIPVYSSEAKRAEIQSRLKSDFENAKTQPPAGRPLYPIHVTFAGSLLSPLEKMAYMQMANPAVSGGPNDWRRYLDLLTATIVREQNPQTRWVALRRLIGSRFTTGFEPFVEIALRGRPDVASASLFHLSEKRRVFELFDVLGRFQQESATSRAGARQDKEPLAALAYQLLRAMIDYPDPQSDALAQLVERGRLDAVFQRRMEDFFSALVRTEGVNAPASIRILRGKDHAGQPFFPEAELQAAADRAAASGDPYLSQVFQRELARRDLVGVSGHSKFGYGASFVEKGFLYLRDLNQIDALARSRENYFYDLRFLHSSPYWTEIFPLDPEVLAVLAEKGPLPAPLPAAPPAPVLPAGCLSFGRDVQDPAFRRLANPERSVLIKDLGMKRDYATLVLLLRDPFIRSRYAGDILDWLLLTPEARWELARYYSRSTDRRLLDLIDQRQFIVEVLADINDTIRRLEKTSLTDAPETHPAGGIPLDPSVIHIYQQLLLRFWQRTPSEHERFEDLLAWVGLLPSAFELVNDPASLYRPLQKEGIAEDDFRSAIRYVRQRRALKHAVERQRQNRAENWQVEIHPGGEETVLRQAVEDVEPGMPPRQSPLALFEGRIAACPVADGADDSRLALQDTLRLVRIRDDEFATGKRERLRFADITASFSRIVLAPLWLLALVPLIWIVKLALIPLAGLRSSSRYSPRYFRNSLRRAEKLLGSIEDHNPAKKRIAEWVETLKHDSFNVDRLVRLQETAKQIMNFGDFLYQVSPAGDRDGPQVQDAQHLDCLNTEVSWHIAPRLTLLALVCRLTAERIWEAARQDLGGSNTAVRPPGSPSCNEGGLLVPPGDERRLYLLMEWFLQRSAYFSGFRYTLNPLANYHLAARYIWRDIPSVDSTGQSAVVRGLLLPVNLLIAALNFFCRVFLALPMRFIYLLAPISWWASAVFRASVRRLVIDAGNALEEYLYPDPAALMERTRQRLRTRLAHQPPPTDFPVSLFLYSFSRVTTRMFSYVLVAIIPAGMLLYVYAWLTPHGWGSTWNLRTAGIYAAIGSTALLSMKMFLYLLPMFVGWAPVPHLRNLNEARRLRKMARKTLLTAADRDLAGRVHADEALRKWNFDDALGRLRAERESDAPLMDVLVLMVENFALLNRYCELAQSLVSRRTAVLAYPTEDTMDGGGARLETLKTIWDEYQDIRQRYPHLPPRFEQTRSVFMTIGRDCDALIELPVAVDSFVAPQNGHPAHLTPFTLAIANAQALLHHSFTFVEEGTVNRFVGSITISPHRLYVGPHNVDQGGKFRGGITLLGAFESIRTAGSQKALVIMGKRAFIRNSSEQLRAIIQGDSDLGQWLDPLNTEKRQLPVAQLVLERFRTSERYGRHIHTCTRYIEEIEKIKADLLAAGRQGERDVSDEEFLAGIAIHYMRHLIVPWFIAFQGGSLENYRSAVLTGNLSVQDRRRMFHQRVLDLVELFQEEGRQTGRQLPKVRFVSAPYARMHQAKTNRDAESLWTNPRLLFPTAPPMPAPAAERQGRPYKTLEAA